MVTNASEETFRPTCFMLAMDLKPEMDAPNAVSTATFSLTEYSKYIPAFLAIFEKVSPISDAGVPGYVVATFTPDSNAPLTTASFPSKSSVPLFLSMSIKLLFP